MTNTMKSEPVRFGVVGVNSRIRRAILAGIAGSKRARLAAVCSRDPIKAEEVAGQYGGAAYTSFDAMLGDRSIDVVFISTPHALHHPMAMQALRAGKAVVCEKPLALTAPQAEELVLAAETSGVAALVNFTYHSLPGQRLIERVVARGDVGELRHLDLTYWQARQRLPNAVPNDALLDVGPHLVDLLLWWGQAGQTGLIASLTAQDDQPADGHSRIVTALGRTESGCQVSLQLNRIAAGFRNAMMCRLIGTDGTATLSFDTDRAEVSLARFGDGGPEGSTHMLPMPDDLAVSYQDFPAFHLDRIAAALQGEGEFPDFRHGLQVQRVLDALRTSIADRRWVEVLPG